MQISHLSLEYVSVEVNATRAGDAYDPTGDKVELAFVALDTDPAPGDWVLGGWETSGAGRFARHFAAALVGPGAKELTVGEYAVWCRVTDNPEIPVQQSPEPLSIT